MTIVVALAFGAVVGYVWRCLGLATCECCGHVAEPATWCRTCGRFECWTCYESCDVGEANRTTRNDAEG